MKKILIWGTGKIASEFLASDYQADTIGFIQTNKTLESFYGHPVFSVLELPDEFDCILIANHYSDQVYETCICNRIDLRKVIFLVRGAKTVFRNIRGLREMLGEKNYTKYLLEYGVTEESFVDQDAQIYDKLNRRPTFAIQKEYNWPIIKDKYANAGQMGNYFWQDLWAAKKIIHNGDKEHFDIGSRIDGFIAHLLAVDIKVHMIDIRPFPGRVEGLYTIVDDATQLSHFSDNSIHSLSALCSLEHFGLGRYGDEINPEACFQCFKQIQNKMAREGNVYLSVPIGKERVEFNAHRVFYAKTIIDCFDKLELLEFSCTSENRIEMNVSVDRYDEDLHDGEYRYGLFHFIKR